MPKVKIAIVNILVLSFLICLNPSGFAIGPCPGGDCPKTLPTIPGTVNCNPDWPIIWAEDNSQEISRGGNVKLKFKGGTRPYDLEVSGTGFWFDQAHTITTIQDNITGTVTVYADSSACGSATITVSNECAAPTTGYVRCPEAGTWAARSYECKCPGPKDYKSGLWVYKTCGKWRNGNRYAMCVGFSDWAGCPTMVEKEYCDSKCNLDVCNATWGCSECVEFSCSDYGAYDNQDGWLCRYTICPNGYYRTNSCFGAVGRSLQEWQCN